VRRPLGSSLDLATKLVTADVAPGWVLGLYPDAGEASGTFHYRSQPRRCPTPGPALDPDRSMSEAARRARTQLRRYVAANRLDHLWSLTYRGAGLHDECRLRGHVAHFFKRVRYEIISEPYPYVWVPEWHKTDHGLHVHFAVNRFLEHKAIESLWGRGYVFVSPPKGRAGTLQAARGSARYLEKYVAKTFEDRQRMHRLHRYERAQGFSPRVERIIGTSPIDAIEQASDRMERSPAHVWTSDESDDWQGPPALWMGWDD
jgi:hypothetical protein